MKTPLFTVAIPLYNKEKSIARTLQSVFEQTFSDFEIIVVNDGSTDNSLESIRNVKDSRLKIIDKANGGVSSARNRAIAESKGEFISFLDADDIWKPNHLQTIKELIDTMPKARVFATRHQTSVFQLKSANGSFYVKNYAIGNIVEKARVGSGLLCSTTITVKMDCFIKTGVFNENYHYGEDLDMWRRLCDEYWLAKSKQVTATYMLDAENRALNRLPEETKNKVENQRGTLKGYSEKIEYGFEIVYKHLRKGLTSDKWVIILKNLDVVTIGLSIYVFNYLFRNER